MRPRPPQPGTERIDTEAVHGSPDLAKLTRLGLDPDSILDFSTNLNPFLQPSARLREVLGGVPPHRHPDPRALVLRQTLADGLGVGADKIFAGNGSSELIWLTTLAFLREGDQALIVGPTYSEYAQAVQRTGAVAHHSLGRAEAGCHVTAADVDTFLPGPRGRGSRDSRDHAPSRHPGSGLRLVRAAGVHPLEHADARRERATPGYANGDLRI